jgi:hypothetical protein
MILKILFWQFWLCGSIIIFTAFPWLNIGCQVTLATPCVSCHNLIHKIRQVCPTSESLLVTRQSGKRYSSPWNRPRKPRGRVQVSLYSFVNLGANRMGGQRHASTALTPGKRPGTHWIGGWVGYTACLDGHGKSCPPVGSDPRTVQPPPPRRASVPGPSIP